jgi:hypothetical protein
MNEVSFTHVCHSLLFSFSPLPTRPTAMTTNLTLIIPIFAVGYLMLVYGALALAKRSERTSRPEG